MRVTAAASQMSPFYRGYRRMPCGSMVGGVAPDPGSWHFALMAIMWQGFGVSFGPGTGEVRANGGILPLGRYIAATACRFLGQAYRGGAPVIRQGSITQDRRTGSSVVTS